MNDEKIIILSEKKAKEDPLTIEQEELILKNKKNQERMQIERKRNNDAIVRQFNLKKNKSQRR